MCDFLPVVLGIVLEGRPRAVAVSLVAKAGAVVVMYTTDVATRDDEDPPVLYRFADSRFLPCRSVSHDNAEFVVGPVTHFSEVSISGGQRISCIGSYGAQLDSDRSDMKRLYNGGQPSRPFDNRYALLRAQAR